MGGFTFFESMFGYRYSKELLDNLKKRCLTARGIFTFPIKRDIGDCDYQSRFGNVMDKMENEKSRIIRGESDKLSKETVEKLNFIFRRSDAMFYYNIGFYPGDRK